MDTQSPIQPTVSPTEPAPTTPAAAPAPNFVGNTNIVDRSTPELYPTPVSPAAPTPFQPASLPSDNQYNEASSAFQEAIVLILGIASSTIYIVLLYFVKNLWAIGVVSFVVAIIAVVVAIINYRKSKTVSPLTVVGLSAATYTIVSVANIVTAQIVINSAYNSLTGY